MTMAGEPILIVDDNPTNLKLLEYLLSSRGYEVRSAADAQQALTLVESFHPRLMLVDLQLPGMDGRELTRRLKSDPRTHDVIIVAVTAYAMKGDEEKARAAGCDAYVTKPIDTRGLALKVAELLAAKPA